MKKDVKKQLHPVIENLIKIMNDRKLRKVEFAELIDFAPEKWNKISNGHQNLSVDELSKIARNLQMREIDVWTYPNVCIETERSDSSIKTQITVELKEELKTQVLDLVFGKKILKILNS